MKSKRVTKFDFSVKNVTAAALQETRVHREDGLYPITFRITYNRIQKRYKSGIKLTVKEWDNIEKSNNKDLKNKRSEIQTGIATLKAIIEDITHDKPFGFQLFNRKLSMGKTDKLIEAFEWKVRDLTTAGRIGTAEYYNTSLKRIKKFSPPGVMFADVTPDWLQRFEAWMFKDGKSYTTIGMNMRAIRAIINEYGEGITYPFGEGLYKIPEGSGRKKALSIDQIGKIIAAPLLTETEKRCRDLWFFSYLANGININDMLRLRYSDIIGDEISWNRKKTFRSKRNKNKTIAVYLPEMKNIVTRWGNPDRKPDQYIFPYLYTDVTPIDEKRIVKNVTSLINKKMILLGNRLGIGPVTTYTARHSFATVLKRSGANIAYISEALSHSDIKTTQSYLDSFESGERKRNAQQLTKF